MNNSLFCVILDMKMEQSNCGNYKIASVKWPSGKSVSLPPILFPYMYIVYSKYWYLKSSKHSTMWNRNPCNTKNDAISFNGCHWKGFVCHGEFDMFLVKAELKFSSIFSHTWKSKRKILNDCNIAICLHPGHQMATPKTHTCSWGIIVRVPVVKLDISGL